MSGPNLYALLSQVDSFAEIAAILEQHQPRLLERPMQEVQIPRNLRNLLGPYDHYDLVRTYLGDADRLLNGRHLKNPRGKLLSHVRKWILAHGDGPRPPAPPKRPTSEDGILAWARERKIESELRRTLIHVDLSTSGRTFFNFHYSPIGRWTVLRAMSDPTAVQFERASRQMIDALWGHLEEIERLAEEGEREERALGMGQPRPPFDPRLAAAAAKVAELRASLRAECYRRPLRKLPQRLELEPRAAPVFRLFEDQRYGSSLATEVHLGLAPGQSLSARCTCDAAPCVHIVGAVDLLHLILRGDIKHPLRDELVDALAANPWERALAALDRAAADEVEHGRYWWQLLHDHAGWTIQPFYQTLGKRGGWLKPKYRSSLPDALVPPEDELILDLLPRERSGYDRPAILALLRSLVHHPRVFTGEWDDTAFRILPSTLSLAVADEEHGYVLTPIAGGQRFTAASVIERLRRSGLRHHLIHMEAGRPHIHLVRVPPTLEATLEALERHAAPIPHSERRAIIDRVPELKKRADLSLPASLVGQELAPEARVVLVIEGRGVEDLTVLVRMRPLANGPLVEPGEGPEQLITDTRDREIISTRRLLAEEPRVAREAIAKLTPHPIEGGRLLLPGPDEALDLIKALRAQDEVEAAWPQGRANLHRVGARDLTVSVRERGDWFGLEGSGEIDGQRVTLAMLLEAVRAGRRYVKLGEAHYAELEKGLRDRLDELAPSVYEGKGGLELSPTGFEDLEALGAEAARFEAETRWTELRARIAAAGALDPAVPEALRAELRPYQIDGFRWLSRLATWGAGAILADDMGLGKTLQALALLVSRASGPALVVAPTSVGFNWIREAERFAPTLDVRSYRGPDRAKLLDGLGPGQVLVTSYGILRRDQEAFAGKKFATVVIDEAQAIKNAATKGARAVFALDAEFTVALTGTPIENHLGELWSIFRAVFPGLLGSLERFRARFAVPIERDRDKKRAGALAKAIRPFVLRRTKGEVAKELPPRTEIQVDVTLSPKERDLYEDVRLTAVAHLKKLNLGHESRFEVLTMMTRLRQLACHPRLYDPKSKVPSSKLARLVSLLEELLEEGQRALVFSQFVQHLSLVREALEAAKIPYLYLDGSTPASEREDRVRRFQALEAPVFLISLKAGGTGLNLTAADNVVHLDPWWNPAVEDQATDRAHRIGQDKPVSVYRLVARGTIEDEILKLHGAKRALLSDVLEGSDAAQSLSTAELAELITRGSAVEADEDEDELSSPPGPA